VVALPLEVRDNPLFALREALTQPAIPLQPGSLKQ